MKSIQRSLVIATVVTAVIIAVIAGARAIEREHLFWANQPVPTRPASVEANLANMDHGVISNPPAIAVAVPNKIVVDDAAARAYKLMSVATPFDQIRLGSGVRLFRYRPAWLPDNFFITDKGRIVITFWPPAARTQTGVPKEVGFLSRGSITRILLPHSPYYSLGIVNEAGPIPHLEGTPLNAEDKVEDYGLLPNGSVVPWSSVPAASRGRNSLQACEQGSLASGMALYASTPYGVTRPILTYAEWRRATFGLWRDEELGCAGPFANEYYTGLGNGSAGALYRISAGRMIMVGAGMDPAITEHVMVLESFDHDEIIEAYWP